MIITDYAFYVAFIFAFLDDSVCSSPADMLSGLVQLVNREKQRKTCLVELIL